MKFLAARAKKFQQLLEFGFRANGDAGESGTEIMASLAHQNVMAGQFLEKGRAALAEIGEQEIRGSGKHADAAAARVRGQTTLRKRFDIANVARDCFALFDGGNAAHESGKIDGIRRHRATHERQGIALTDYGAEAQARHSFGFRKCASDKQIRKSPNPRHRGFRGKFGVGFIETHDRVRRGANQFANGVDGHQSAGGIIGIGQEK